MIFARYDLDTRKYTELPGSSWGYEEDFPSLVSLDNIGEFWLYPAFSRDSLGLRIHRNDVVFAYPELQRVLVLPSWPRYSFSASIRGPEPYTVDRILEDENGSLVVNRVTWDPNSEANMRSFRVGKYTPADDAAKVYWAGSEWLVFGKNNVLHAMDAEGTMEYCKLDLSDAGSVDAMAVEVSAGTGRIAAVFQEADGCVARVWELGAAEGPPERFTLLAEFPLTPRK
jgi:hypothetical protein